MYGICNRDTGEVLSTFPTRREAVEAAWKMMDAAGCPRLVVRRVL